MANMNIGTPRFYPDLLSYLMSRGVAQNGNFDVTASNTTNKFMGTFTTGSEPELFDMNPLNKCTFDTSADTDAHVLITIDTQSTTFKKSYIASAPSTEPPIPIIIKDENFLNCFNFFFVKLYL